MQTGRHAWRADAEEGGLRLDVAITRRLAELSRSRVQALIDEGQITLNGAAPKTSAKVRAGDEIAVTIPDPRPVETMAEDIPLDVIFEDDDLIVINKPPGLVVHPGAGNQEHTLVNALLHHCQDNLSGIGGELRPGIVHRLDKDTSGCLVAAKNDVAHQELARQFASRETVKVYLAVVRGTPKEKVTEIRYAIQRHPVNRKKMQAVSANIARGPDARNSHTTATLLAEGNGISLVRCRLHTGRTHQIRVHMAAIGHPLVGDETYGGPSRPGVTRQLLHAWKLAITHPRTAQRLELSAPPPPDILAEFPEFALS